MKKLSIIIENLPRLKSLKILRYLKFWAFIRSESLEELTI